MRFLISYLLLSSAIMAFGQVKIGNDINNIDAASILELESNSRVFVPTRMSSAQMNAVSPLEGAIVYNTDAESIFVFDGAIWKSLNSKMVVTTAASPPLSNKSGDIFINDSKSQVNVWNGTGWVLINRNPRSGNGAPSAFTIDNPIAGDIYVDRNNGALYTFDGTQWTNSTAIFSVSNGIAKTADNDVELGGNLTKATSIVTDAINTLAVEGLEVAEDDTNMLVTVEQTSGILRRTPISSVVQKEEITLLASDGQNRFNTPSAITDPNKIDVYRNGIKIDFNTINATTIELETSVICYQNDEIRIVQFF